MKKKQLQTAAFSLVEVTVALGICAVCLIGIFGLLPIGVSSGRDAWNKTMAANHITSIVSELHILKSGSSSMRYPSLVAPTAASGSSTSTLYLGDDGSASSTLLTSGSKYSRYRVTITFTPDAVTGGTTVAARILTTWPPSIDPMAKKPAGSFEALTQLTINP